MSALPLILLLMASTGGDNYDEASRLFQKQQFAAAAEALDRALKENPNYTPAWTLRGKIAMAFNRFDVAREAFLKAVRLDPASAQARFMLGFFYYVDNDFRKAVPELKEAARLNPKDPRALLYLAMSEEGLARPEAAVEIYRKTIELETAGGKPNPETHTAYGRLLFALGRYEESAREVARVLQLDPESRDGHYELGRLAFEKSDFALAAAEGEKALRAQGVGTTGRQIHFLLARSYSKLGKRDLAEAHREQFEASPPTLRR